MITEDYVSFDTAKLLKEKGFMDGEIIKFFASGYDKNGHILSIRDTELDDYPRPTLQMAMKWLRKEHNLVISASVTVDGWRTYVSQIKLDGEGFVVDIIDGIDDGNIPSYGTYEKSCEAAIKYCLKNLI